MNAMISVILAVQMLSALVMIGLILMQQGKGADMANTSAPTPSTQQRGNKS